MSIGLRAGARPPAPCTSMGRTPVAALPDAVARSLIEKSDLSPQDLTSLYLPALLKVQAGLRRILP